MLRGAAARAVLDANGARTSNGPIITRIITDAKTSVASSYGVRTM